VASCAPGLECLTGCRAGRVPAALLRGDDHAAAAALDDLISIFGAAHVWVEAQRPAFPDDGPLLHGLARLARRAGVGIAATGDAHYAEERDRDLQDLLVCIRERVPLTRALPHLRQGASWHLRSTEEMARRFRDLPLALRGTRELADRCGFALSHIDAALPAPDLPPGCDARGHLRRLVREGARGRYGAGADAAAVCDRLTHELAVIADLGLEPYFLLVRGIVRYAEDRGILCQARGSAVGSAVCYCLGISAVEPLAHRLSFERFLARGRADPPDIDLDFPAEREGGRPAREQVIQHVLTRYAGHAALVCTAVTFGTRSALRDVGLALGLTPDQLDHLAAERDHGTHGDHGDRGPGDRRPHPSEAAARPEDVANRAGAASLAARADNPVLRRIEELCARLQGIPRHRGQHPGGIVVTGRPLAEVAPLERAAMPGRVIVQWDKDAAEAAGLIKTDHLALGMLAVVDECFEHIAARTGARPALHGFRCDDPAVFDAFCRADTIGVFQLESRAQMTACLPRLRPRTLDDLAAAVALIRPGPIQGGATHPYLRRRQGLEPVTYPGGAAGRALLEPVLGDTLGVCLYQDQVVELAVACGLDGAEAAEVRRAMSNARGSARMAALRGRIAEGLAARGLDAPARAVVLAMMEGFAGYGFVRGHSVAFGYLAYVSCWLKVYHPAAFCAALFNALPLGFYPPDVLLRDARRHGVGVREIDVRRSRARWTVEDTEGNAAEAAVRGAVRGAAGASVRVGLRSVRGLGAEACAQIEEAMRGADPPDDLEELCRRANLDEGEAVALARAGALRGFIPDRRQALWQAPLAARTARARWLPGVTAGVDPPVALPALSEMEEIVLDADALGLSAGRHVLAPLRPALAHRPALRTSADLGRLPAGQAVEVAGLVAARQRPGTAHGVVFLSLSDEEGLIDVVVAPDIYQRDRAIVRGEALLWVEGILERRHGVPTVRARRLRPLADVVPAPPDAATLRPGKEWG